jgi:hypothetical protein
MPDNKTVYTTDDGTNVGFYMFKSDKPGPNFSSGADGSLSNATHGVPRLGLGKESGGGGGASLNTDVVPCE